MDIDERLAARNAATLAQAQSRWDNTAEAGELSDTENGLRFIINNAKEHTVKTPRIKWSEYCKGSVRYAQTRFQGHIVSRMPTLQELIEVESYFAGNFNRIDCWPPLRIPLWQYNPPRFPSQEQTA